MAAEDNLPYYRSPSRASPSTYDISLQQRSFFGPKNSKKAKQKSATDKLVWFSPVHSPLLSPAREKTLQLAKKKSRSSSIFSMQSRPKGFAETEEPTSPKVSCIGQVRVCKKDKDPFAETSKKKSPQSKPGSMSPARFFASPGRARKWGSLFGSHKESCAAPSLAGYGEVPCSDLPFGSDLMYHLDRTGAESLAVLQEGENSGESSYDKVMQVATHAAVYEPSYEKVTRLRAHAADYELCYDKAMQLCTQRADGEMEEPDPWVVDRGFSDRYTHDATDSPVFRDTRPSAVDTPRISQKGGASNSREMGNEGKRSIVHNATNHETFVLEQEHCHSKLLASKQRLAYEELPSLHCGTAMKPDMKISVEVVPETWLWRNREKVRPDTPSQQQACVPETRTSMETSGEDLQKVQEEDIVPCVSPSSNSQFHSQEGELCKDSQVSQHAGSVDKADSVPEGSELEPVKNDTCKPVHVDNERQNDSTCTLMDGGSQVRPTLLTSCPTMDVCKEESKEVTHSAEEDRPNGTQVDQHHFLHCKKLKDEADVEKHKMSVGSPESKNRHRRQRRVGPDVGKENYGVVLSQLVEKKLPSLHANEDGKRLWNVFKGRKSDVFSVQPFSALILVGYEQAMASKDNMQKGTYDEEFFKGVLDVGRPHFHSSAKYFQLLKSDAEFIRSRSATSHRTVITLQRCNSDPCRPSY